MQIKDCKTGTEVVLRAKIAGISADGSSVRIETKEGSAMYYRPELLELVKPAEEIEAKTSTPEEACCCNTTEQAPTVEMIEEAYNRLEEMVNQCKTPVLLHIKIEKGGVVNSRTATCAAVTEMPCPKGTEWLAARGYLAASGNCFSGNPDTISLGVKLAFKEAHRRAGVNPIAAILGIAGCECEECED